MIVGIDFDNTLVSYDTIFHRIAREQNLIPEEVPVHKNEVRNYLRSIGREPAWTEMQGLVYGRRIVEAEAYPGALAFLAEARRRGWTLHIVSHKTRTPIAGEKVDLHEAARSWLNAYQVHEAEIGLPPAHVWLEETKAGKLARIGTLGCDVFIDDLPEFLLDPSFPAKTRRILFDPFGVAKESSAFQIAHSWPEMIALVAHEPAA
jgi:hypothetical protein